MSTIAESGAYRPGASPFARADVCREAGLSLPTAARRPRFADDVWDFTDVVGLPVQMPLARRRFDFAAITDPRWRLVAKELVLALLAPRHDAVAPLSRAYRTALHLNTCFGRLTELTRWLNWLAARGVTSLDQVDAEDCQAYLAHRRQMRDEHGNVVGDMSPATRRAAAQVVVDLVNYRDLFTADRVDAHLRPWKGASPSAVAEMPCGRDENKTQPLDDAVLRPMLAAALYLVTTIGPHAIGLAEQIRDTDRAHNRKTGGLSATTRLPEAELTTLLTDYRHSRRPLPLLPEHHLADRIAGGWNPDDALTPLALDHLAHQAGFRHFHADWIPPMRGALEHTVRTVGAQEWYGRDAAEVERADAEGTTPWTPPLHRLQAVALVGIVRTACIAVTTAVSGMRVSELMELQVGSRRPPQQYGPGLLRYQLASKVVKGQALGGLADEWVVIEPVYRAVQLAERLHDDPCDGAALFGRFAFNIRYQWFRNWVNSPAGQRLGLAPIPAGSVNPRALRRTLALELAYRPGGLLAAKIHLKHVAVATTEGYASRPGGAQAKLLTEVNKHEQQHKLDLALAEFRNYQRGVLPAGPGARDLVEFFAQVDAALNTPDQQEPAARIQPGDHQILNLLTKRAKTLHLGAANYCWFTDPSRALCLKIAGTPTADQPLAGMCDSARCPQATHHPCHRPVWAEHAEKTKTLLVSLGPTRKTEKARLQADYQRTQRVLAEIDAAASSTTDSEERS